MESAHVIAQQEETATNRKRSLAEMLDEDSYNEDDDSDYTDPTTSEDDSYTDTDTDDEVDIPPIADVSMTK